MRMHHLDVFDVLKRRRLANLPRKPLFHVSLCLLVEREVGNWLPWAHVCDSADEQVASPQVRGRTLGSKNDGDEVGAVKRREFVEEPLGGDEGPLPVDHLVREVEGIGAQLTDPWQTEEKSTKERLNAYL